MIDSPVQLEGVGAVSMRCVPLKVLGQVDDHDGLKRTFLHQCGVFLPEKQAGTLLPHAMMLK